MNHDVILVDVQDNQVGTGEKLAVHQAGALHRAFSIFVFNSKGEMMLQHRASGKYHSAGLWTNACCSHPSPGETTEAAAHRRLKEEMGFDCDLTNAGALVYKTHFDNGLTEHEYDHIFIGHFDGEPKINPEEADEYKWADTEWLKKDVEEHPEKYTYWFRLALKDVLAKRE